jgi:arylformamidase
MARLYDISLPITEGMLSYPGNPPTRIRAHAQISDGDDANVTELSFGSHTGTHVDAAHHFVNGGETVDEIPLDLLIGPALVVEIPAHVTAIGAAELRAAGVGADAPAAEAPVGGSPELARLLLRTRNAALLEQDEFEENFAHLTGDGAAYLVEHGIRLVGIDYLSIEAFDADEPHAHLTLLEHRVVVLEGADLRGVPTGIYELICLPLRIAGIDGSPVRAVLRAAD